MWYVFWMIAVYVTVKLVGGHMAKLESKPNDMDKK